MGMSMQGGRGRRGRAPIGDINVTPLVDVMLVLLIVFMVTAPLLATGVPIDLPQTNAPEMKVDTAKPITVSINAMGEMFLGEDPITLDTLLSSVAARRSPFDNLSSSRSNTRDWLARAARSVRRPTAPGSPISCARPCGRARARARGRARATRSPCPR